MDSPSLRSTLLSTLAIATLAFGLGGCTVRAAQPVVYGTVQAQPVYAEGGPVYDDYVYDDSFGDVEASAPYVVYQGEPTYYVQGRWYRRTPRGWAYYRSEPQPLYRRRPRVQVYGTGRVNTAPPAYRRNTAPPARRGNTAPPAR